MVLIECEKRNRKTGRKRGFEGCECERERAGGTGG